MADPNVIEAFKYMQHAINWLAAGSKWRARMSAAGAVARLAAAESGTTTPPPTPEERHHANTCGICPESPEHRGRCLRGAPAFVRAPDGTCACRVCNPAPESTPEAALEAEVERLRTLGREAHEVIAAFMRPAAPPSDVVEHLRETVWLVAEAFGAKRDCPGCEAVVRKTDKRKLGYACLAHGPHAKPAGAIPAEGHGAVAALSERFSMRGSMVAGSQAHGLHRAAAAAPETASAPLPTCPDCLRVKAACAIDASTGACPKWWAIRDPEAERDCAKHTPTPPHPVAP